MIDRLLLRLLALGGIVIAFGIVIIFAGHGSAPVALLMVLGAPRAWLSSQLPGWLGLLVSLAAVFARTESAYRSIRFWGALLLIASVSVFIAHGEVMFISVITATPLLGVAVYCLWRYLASWRTGAGVSDRTRQIVWAVAALAVSLAIEAVFLLPMFVRETLVREQVIEIVQFVAREPSLMTAVTGVMLALDIAIVALLLSRPASAWLRGRSRAALAA